MDSGCGFRQGGLCQVDEMEGQLGKGVTGMGQR